MTLKDVEVSRLDPGRFEAVLDPDDCRRFLGRLKLAADRLAGRRLWQVNSTERGGGVAEMLHFLLGYLAAPGIDTRRLVLEGNQDFLPSPNASTTCSTASPATGASWTSRHEPATARRSKKRSESWSHGSSLATSSSCTTPRPPGWHPP